MAVKLRLRRMGRKKAPVYKLVAADSRAKRDGRFIEAIGQFNPLGDKPSFTYKEDRVQYWLDNGAQPTDTVRNLLSKEGILMKRLLVKRVGEEAAAAKMADWKAKAEGKKAAKAAPVKKAAPKKAETTEEPAAPAENA